jgi:formylglycine-generating enzyme required for sulfatase activity
VIRGGSWINFAGYCTVVHRDEFYPDDRSFNFGFRVALSAAP